MPKGRMLNRSISHSKKVAQLSPQAALLFSWCIPHLDQKGRIYANTHTLKGIVTPYLDYMTHEIIEEGKEELCASGLVFIYGDERFMQFIGFSHNQRIDPTRESPSLIPDPTPEELEMLQKSNAPEQLQSNSGYKYKYKYKYNKSTPSPALQAALDKVFKDGFNIYALLIKTKKQLKQPPGFEFPEDVLLKVCEAYWREKAGIQHRWPWFVKVLADEWVRWNVDQQIAQGAAYKKEGLASSIAEILKGMAK